MVCPRVPHSWYSSQSQLQQMSVRIQCHSFLLSHFLEDQLGSLNSRQQVAISFEFVPDSWFAPFFPNGFCCYADSGTTVQNSNRQDSSILYWKSRISLVLFLDTCDLVYFYWVFTCGMRFLVFNGLELPYLTLLV